MVQIINGSNIALHRQAVDAMHRDRKLIFVDQFKWNVPCEGPFERDQFDDDYAEYLLTAHEMTHEHHGSMRLLRTDRDHILGSLFADLCEQPVPCGPEIREITRLCLSPRLPALRRREVFRQLVTALVEYALLSGITAYTAVTNIRWLSQTLSMGWRCMPLGIPRVVGEEMICAMQIDITPHTIQLLRDAGTYMPIKLRLADENFSIAA